MKYVIVEMVKAFFPLILLLIVFIVGLIGTTVYRKRNPERAEKFRKPLSAASRIIIGFGGGFILLILLGAAVLAFVGVPQQQ